MNANTAVAGLTTEPPRRTERSERLHKKPRAKRFPLVLSPRGESQSEGCSWYKAYL